MKISVNTSDIKGMVMESVKKCLFEGMDIRSLIENLPISQALDPYKQVFGEEALNALSTSRGDIFDVMQQTFDNGTPEQQQEYVARVKGEFQGDDGIDIELDPDVMAMISETVDKVVDNVINEIK